MKEYITKYDDPFAPTTIITRTLDTTYDFNPATLTFTCYNNKGWKVVGLDILRHRDQSIEEYLASLPDWSVNPIGKNDFNIERVLTDEEKKMLNDTFTPMKKKEKKKDINKAYDKAMKGI